MSKREYRRFTAEQKIEILRETDQPGVTVSEVCRRHGLAPSVLYRWQAVAQGGSAVALKRDARRRSSLAMFLAFSGAFCERSLSILSFIARFMRMLAA
jgi:transposase-like protein